MLQSNKTSNNSAFSKLKMTNLSVSDVNLFNNLTITSQDRLNSVNPTQT